MGKFAKGIKTSNQKTEKPVNQETIKPLNQETIKPANQRSIDDLKLVNVGGFKVPKCVRAHWVAQGAIRGEKLAPLLRDFLIERYGLPKDVTMKDFKVKPESQ
ncbi:MAG: hypothetical protein AAGI45_11010 [Cyanobacteria bacterium P01_H01_bin.26]